MTTRALAPVLLALAASWATLAGSPARAESSYWDQRWRSGPADVAASRHERRRARDHVDVRIRKQARGAEPDGFAERSYNGPVYESQEEVQQSVYDFATGGPGNIKSYR